jgi:3-hexulose-6-phosphate synthase/6-phospho-3-hexuloisomerase
MARIGVEAGVDWLEAGTPLIVAEGIKAIGSLAQSFPHTTVLADYKTMDSGFRNVLLTDQQGGHVMTVCANAPDETVQSAIRQGKESDILIVVDTIGVKDQPGRAKLCAQWGADMIYLHYGTDQRRADDSHDSTQWLEEVIDAVHIPVAVGTFGTPDAVRAVAGGATLVCIGHPLISCDNPRAALTDYVRQVKANYKASV